MVTIFNILMVVFWIQGRAVCDELYPISVVEDIVQNQPEWSSDNYDEPRQGQFFDEEFLPSNSQEIDRADLADLEWMKTAIVKRYNFGKYPDKDAWKSQPNFKADLQRREFANTAVRVKKFFDRNNNWEETKEKFRNGRSCINLLYITAARYVLVTHILYKLSSHNLVPCSRTISKKILIPDSGVCYPEPYGTATCTSDYDVGLIGRDAGFLTEKFNNYFQGDDGFGKPSELVFDTNVYAFTLEFAMPFLFVKLPVDLANGVVQREKTVCYKMQELASAYYKVFKYNATFFEIMKNGAMNAMTRNALESKTNLDKWLKIFKDFNRVVPLTGGGHDLRKRHNIEYQGLVKKMSVGGGYKPNFLGTLVKALMYAAEAYHTRGAIRHVVGGTQMKVVNTATALTTNDLWVSMIENWGEANKEYNHCRMEAVEKCFLKMSKYLWRMFNAMRLIRGHIPASARPGLVHFGERFGDPEFAMQMWLDYKKKGATAIPKHKGNVKVFLRQFHCDGVVLGSPLSPTCMSKMNDKVNAYNVKLAATLSDKPVKQAWRL